MYLYTEKNSEYNTWAHKLDNRFSLYLYSLGKTNQELLVTSKYTVIYKCVILNGQFSTIF